MKSRKQIKVDYVMVEAQEKPIPVVEEFVDIFEEIPGLPPDREIEFCIDIIL